MKIQCDYCKNTYEDTLPKCPSCGAPNPSHNDGDKKPRTIAELKKWYEDRHLPPENVTRFFIGKNITEPRAFGIYQDENGDFIVYKNKDTGVRAIRYQGKDEQYAVNELWQKLKDEIVHQKHNSQTRANSSSNSAKGISPKRFLLFFFIIWLSIWILAGTIIIKANKYNGYYHYDDAVYYHDGSHWYLYDSDYYDDWYPTSAPAQYDPNNIDPYYMGRDYSDAQAWGYSAETFSDAKSSDVYQDNHQSSSDSDYDWGGGDSWDSGGTDWGSDW